MKAAKPHTKSSAEAPAPARDVPEVIELPPSAGSGESPPPRAAEPAPPDPFNEEGASDPTLFEDPPTAPTSESGAKTAKPTRQDGR